MAGIGRLVWNWTAGVLAAFIILSALLLGLFRVFVSHVPEYRQPVELRAMEAIGLPVEIGRLDARLGFGGPEVVFVGVRILDEAEGSPIVQARRGTLSVNVVQSLLDWKIRWDAVSLDGVELDVVRDSEGVFRVLGLPLEDFQRREPGSLPDGSLRLKESRLVFRDQMEGGTTWVLDNANLDITNSAGSLGISGDFDPPPGVADRVVFWANQDHETEAWQAYVSLADFDFAVLQRLPGLPDITPSAGKSDTRLWVDWKDRVISRLSADFLVTDLVLPGADDQDDVPDGYQRLSGRIEWDQRPSGWQAMARDLEVRHTGRQWRTDRLRIEKTVNPATAEGTFYVDTDVIRLEELLPIAPYIPDQALREDILALRPEGEIRGLVAQLTIEDRDPRGFTLELEADVTGGAVRTRGRIPGISGFAGRIRSDGRGGRLELDAREMELDMPWLFRQPLVLQEARGLFVWSRGAEGLTVIGDGITVANSDLRMETGFRVQLPGQGEPGTIDLQAELSDVNVATASTYLPVGIMSETVVRWLDRALVSGRVPSAAAVMRGPLKGFPYREDQGLFRVSFGTRDLVLDYANDWPRAEGVVADIVFENEGFSAQVNEGIMHGVAVERVTAGFADMGLGMLEIRGEAGGALATVKEYALQIPLPAGLRGGLELTHVGSGEGRIDVDLLLPVKDLASREIDIDLHIADATVNYGQVQDPFSELTGTINIGREHARGDGLTARLLGEPVTIDIRPYQDIGTRAYIRGPLTRSALVEGLRLPLGDYISGDGTWTGYAHFPNAESGGSFFMHLASDLEGMELGFPAPLDKAATESLPLSMYFEFPEEGKTDWRVVLGERLAAIMRSSIGDGAIRFERGNIRGGADEVELTATQGLVIEGHLARFSLDEWLGVRFGEGGDTALEDVIAGAALSIDEFFVANQRIAAAQVRLSHEENAWQLRIDSESVAGTVTAPHDVAARAEPIVLTMERLAIDDEEADAGEGALDPATVPPLKVTADHFSMEQIDFGRMEMDLIAVPNGFEVPSFSTSGPSFTLTGTAGSVLGPALDRSYLSLKLDSSDLSETFEFMGFESGVDANEGRMNVDLEWTGGIPENILEVAEGTASIKLKDGSLTDVKPGAGRMFGLLGVDALPRRLMLDFRDVFKKGFFFDELKGDFKITQGKAFTDNLVFRSPAADIGIVGTVDLLGREYDQVAVVSADVGNTLPIVGAIAAGPVIGAGLFVLKEIFKEPLRGAIQVQYQITGPWEDPVVEQVAAATAEEEKETQISQQAAEADPEDG